MGNNFKATNVAASTTTATNAPVAQAQGFAVATQAQIVKQATRAQRLLKQATLLLAKHVAAKQATFTTATNKAKNNAYQLAVAQLQAQYGIAPTVQLARTNGAPVHAPSTAQQGGVCKQVHAIAAQCNGVRSATLAACAAAGINPATAATQYAVYKKAHPSN